MVHTDKRGGGGGGGRENRAGLRERRPDGANYYAIFFFLYGKIP